MPCFRSISTNRNRSSRVSLSGVTAKNSTFGFASSSSSSRWFSGFDFSIWRSPKNFYGSWWNRHPIKGCRRLSDYRALVGSRRTCMKRLLVSVRFGLAIVSTIVLPAFSALSFRSSFSPALTPKLRVFIDERRLIWFSGMCASIWTSQKPPQSGSLACNKWTRPALVGGLPCSFRHPALIAMLECICKSG